VAVERERMIAGVKRELFRGRVNEPDVRVQDGGKFRNEPRAQQMPCVFLFRVLRMLKRIVDPHLKLVCALFADVFEGLLDCVARL
jgi:hypothetical protein